MEKLPKSVAKVIKSLQIKKFREQLGLFIVQGEKSFDELSKSDFEIEEIVSTPEFLTQRPYLMRTNARLWTSSENELSAIGSLATNTAVLAVVKKKNQPISWNAPENFFLILDDVRDPGNLGTIIRTADWFGIRDIVASPATVDFYNPKVINATMGSFTRVNYFTSDLKELLSRHPVPLYITALDGENIHQAGKLPYGGIVLGNESAGVGDWWKNLPHRKLTIPGSGTESLNVAVSCGIVLDRLSQFNR